MESYLVTMISFFFNFDFMSSLLVSTKLTMSSQKYRNEVVTDPMAKFESGNDTFPEESRKFPKTGWNNRLLRLGIKAITSPMTQATVLY